MGMSDKIESFICELLKEEDSEWLEIRRNELASFFNCVPSQINYVIATRFCPERGYAVESRRGGGGYVRIRKISCGDENPIMAVINQAGSSISYTEAASALSRLLQVQAITAREAQIMLAALSDSSLPLQQPDKDRLRAIILKNMLISAAK